MEKWTDIFRRRSIQLWPNRSQNVMFDNIELKQGKPPKIVKDRILSARQRLAALPPEDNLPPRDENPSPVGVRPPTNLGSEGATLEIEKTFEDKDAVVVSSTNTNF